MGVPKKKVTRSRRDKRRTHYRAIARALTKCPQCGQPRLPHRACGNCGYYAGRQVIIPSEV